MVDTTIIETQACLNDQIKFQQENQLQNQRQLNVDRVSFIKNIKFDGVDKLETYIKNYFDEIMGVYNIVLNRQSDNIHMKILDDGKLQFSFEYYDSTVANKVMDCLIYYDFIPIYEKRYRMQLNINLNIIEITLIEMTDDVGL